MQTKPLTQCFAEYVEMKLPRNTKESSLSREPMASFCGVTTRTVERWQYGRSIPQGEPLVLLRVFLWVQGFPVHELVTLSETARKLTALLVFGGFTTDNLKINLNYYNVHDVFRVLHGSGNCSPERILEVNALWAQYRELLSSEQLQLVEGDFSKYVRQEVSSTVLPEGDVKSEDLRSPGSPESSEHVSEPSKLEVSLETVAYLILCLLPMAEALASERFSSEDRRSLRDMTGGRGVFELSNALNQLCGEEARKRLLANSHANGRSPKS